MKYRNSSLQQLRSRLAGDSPLLFQEKDFFQNWTPKFRQPEILEHLLIKGNRLSVMTQIRGTPPSGVPLRWDFTQKPKKSEKNQNNFKN